MKVSENKETALNYKKNSYCSYCGSKFTEQKNWPRKCFVCYNESFSNPLPVVVVLIPVVDYVAEGCGTKKVSGLLIQQRNIEPAKGGWALTGGYIDNLETWKAAAVREVKEELGLQIKEDELELYDVDSSSKKDCILICCRLSTAYDWRGGEYWNGLPDIIKYYGHTFPNEEVQAWDVMWEERELAFPAHNYWANKFLKELKGK